MLMNEGTKYISNNAHEINSDLNSIHGFMYHGINLMANVLNRVQLEHDYNKKQMEEIKARFL